MTQISFFIVEFEMLERFAVAAPETNTASHVVDRPLAVDGAGRPWLPPSSLAGGLRMHLGGDAESLMGPLPSTTDRDEQGVSPLWVLGTELDSMTVSLVHRTAIDPHRGAARSKTLRSEEVIEPGATGRVYLRLDHKDDVPDGTESAALAEGLLAWPLVIGGGSGIGRGSGRVTSVWHGTIDLADRTSLTQWLTLGGPELARAVATSEIRAGAADDAGGIVWEFEVVDALRTDSELTGNERLLRRSVPGDSIVIRGSSLRGVFRQRASFILRTLGHDVCTSAQGCGECVICGFFGSSARRGLLRFVDSPISDPITVIRTHVAIDRISGGSTPGHLFSEEVVTDGTFKVVVQRTGQCQWPGWAKPLLQLVADDIHEGYVGLGGGTARGQGTVRLVQPDVLPEQDEIVESLDRELPRRDPEEDQ